MMTPKKMDFDSRMLESGNPWTKRVVKEFRLLLS
jgi:hypothetical protein